MLCGILYFYFMNQVITVSYKDVIPNGYMEINCTSWGKDKWSALSPFVNRQISAYDGLISQNMENLWQYSKVYEQHVFMDNILPEWFEWRNQGFAKTKADRYPMGKGKKPLFTYWNGNRLSYIEARKQVYFPKYEESVIDTDVFKDLLNLYMKGELLAIRDFDVYRFDLLGMTIEEVINNSNKKAGHGFVLYKMLNK